MRAFKVIVSCLSIAAVTSLATAQNEPPKPPPAGGQPGAERPARGQRPGGRQAMTEEQSKAAWTLEANGVSKRLGLDADKTKAVAKAYAEARESYDKAQRDHMQKMRDKMRDSDDPAALRSEMMKEMEEMNKTEKDKLEKALSSSLSSEQVTKAMGSLGSLAMGRQWDNMAHSISEFKLDASKQESALNAVEDYVVALSKAPRPGPNADREEMQKTMKETRDKLNESLKKILSEEQYKKFEEAHPGMGRFGPGGPGGPGGRGGRNRQNDGG